MITSTIISSAGRRRRERDARHREPDAAPSATQASCNVGGLGRRGNVADLHVQHGDPALRGPHGHGKHGTERRRSPGTINSNARRRRSCSSRASIRARSTSARSACSTRAHARPLRRDRGRRRRVPAREPGATSPTATAATSRISIPLGPGGLPPGLTIYNQGVVISDDEQPAAAERPVPHHDAGDQEHVTS